MKAAYLGIDLLYPALEALAETGVEVIKIFTCPRLYKAESNERVIDFAKSHHIPYTEQRVTKADLEELKDAGCELLLCAGYYYLVPITDAFPMVNIHPAPLPACRGAWPMPWLLLWGEAFGGVTLHKMANRFDTGEILLSQTFPLAEGDTLADYMAKANALVPDMVQELLAHLPHLLANATPQGEGRYLKNPDENDYTLTPSMTTEDADRILRAFYGYECIYKGENGKEEILFARAEKGNDPTAKYPLSDGYIVVGRYA